MIYEANIIFKCVGIDTDNSVVMASEINGAYRRYVKLHVMRDGVLE